MIFVLYLDLFEKGFRNVRLNLKVRGQFGNPKEGLILLGAKCIFAIVLFCVAVRGPHNSHRTGGCVVSGDKATGT